MARPITATEPQPKRTATLTFATVAEKLAAQRHAAKKGQSLAGLLKLLLAADMAGSAPSTPTQGGGGPL